MYKLVIGKPAKLNGAIVKYQTLWVNLDPLEQPFGIFFYVLMLNGTALGVLREGVYFQAYHSFGPRLAIPADRQVICEVDI